MWPMRVAMPYQTSDTVLIDRTMAQSTPPMLAMGSVPMPGRMTGLGGKEGGRLWCAFARAVCRVSLSSYL
jgi:hypothetical protein